jgi:hypothetical protein
MGMVNVPRPLADCFPGHEICDMACDYMMERPGNKEFKTIDVFRGMGDGKTVEVLVHPSLTPEDQEPFIAYLYARKHKILSIFSVDELNMELQRRPLRDWIKNH